MSITPKLQQVSTWIAPLTCFVLLVGGPHAARATLIVSDTATFAGSSTQPIATVELAQFNPANGSLLGIEIDVTVDVTASGVTVTNPPGIPFPITGNVSVSATSTAETALAFASKLAGYTLDPGHSQNIGQIMGSSATGMGAEAPSFPDPDPTFVGVGTREVLVNTLASISVTAPALLTFSDVKYSGAVTITYTYTHVPEPATLFLGLLGGAGLLLVGAAARQKSVTPLESKGERQVIPWQLEDRGGATGGRG